MMINLNLVRSEFVLDAGTCCLFKYILVTRWRTLHYRSVERLMSRNFQCACGAENGHLVSQCQVDFIDAIHAHLLRHDCSLGLDLFGFVHNLCKLCLVLRYSVVLPFLLQPRSTGLS